MMEMPDALFRSIWFDVGGEMLQELSWDSAFLRIRVARIAPDITYAELPECLSEAHSKGFRLAYWATACGSVLEADAQRYRQQHIVDQVTLRKNCECPCPGRMLTGEYMLKLVAPDDSFSDLFELSYEAGWSSRFRLDTRLASNVFPRLYRTWIERSCQGQIADAVYVVRCSDYSPAGLVTLAISGATCSIGLIAVSREHRRRGLAGVLIQTAEEFAERHNCRQLSVVTQVQNSAAVALYKSAGFEQTDCTAWYHFWLNDDVRDL